jgi:asparagine synthase (glutamine-hydrolysing)
VTAIPRQRAQALGIRNRQILARHRQVEYSSPLLHADFVHAIGRQGGFFGPGDRTAVLRSLVPDLLPDAVLARTSKAVFNGSYMARHTREFASQWNGDGVDHEFVDADELRRGWLSGTRMGLTMGLLQSAWLATSSPVAPSRREPPIGVARPSES